MSLGGRVLGAITGAAMVVAALAGAEPQIFRFRAERSVLETREFADVRQEAREARARGEGLQRGSHRAILDKVFSVLAGAAHEKDTFRDWAFHSWPVEELARRAQMDETTFRRACNWLVKKGRLRVISRFKKDTRRDESGKVRWKQRTNVYIVFLKPVHSASEADGLAPDDVIRIASAYRNRPNKIAAVLRVADAYDLADRGGHPWTEEELTAALRQAGSGKAAGTDSDVGDDTKSPSTASSKTTKGGADRRSGKGADAPSVPDYEAFAVVFTETRRERYQNDLVGIPKHEDQLAIGAYVRGLARQACALPQGAGCDAETAFAELAAELTRAYLARPGGKWAGGDSYLADKGHPLTALRDDLHACGTIALKRWAKRRKKADAPTVEAPAAEPGPPARRGSAAATAAFADLLPKGALDPAPTSEDGAPDSGADAEPQEIAAARPELLELGGHSDGAEPGRTVERPKPP